MEGVPQFESGKGKTEKQEAIENISHVVAKWGAEFKQLQQENTEVPHVTGDVLYEFAKFIKKKSERLLKEAKEQGEYRKEGATAKLHDYNLAQTRLLVHTAEIVEFYPDIVDELAQTFPWLIDMKRWAESIKD